MKTYDEAFQTAFNLTAFFETDGNPYSAPSGNFDGQGISWGPRQNCLGQGSLQPVLRRMVTEQETLVSNTFGPLYDDLKSILAEPTTKTQTDMAIKLANVLSTGSKPRWNLKPEWQAAFAELGKSPAIQAIFVEEAKGSRPAVDDLAQWIAKGSVVTVRMYCLAYDIVTQNGGVGSALRMALTAGRPFLSVYRQKLLDKGRTVDWAWMSIVAGCRALQTRITGQIEFAKDVEARKFLIIDGRGTFRGDTVDLEHSYDVTDEAVG